VENRFEPQYVADPKVPYTIEEEVDITLVDANNNELDMGHHLIFFWEEASHGYDKLSEVLNNRIVLKV
jgi:hypothetical protein